MSGPAMLLPVVPQPGLQSAQTGGAGGPGETGPGVGSAGTVLGSPSSSAGGDGPAPELLPAPAVEGVLPELVELLPLDPAGELAVDLAARSLSLAQVAVQSAASPHLHPAAPALGRGPRLPLPAALSGEMAPKPVAPSPSMQVTYTPPRPAPVAPGVASHTGVSSGTFDATPWMQADVSPTPSALQSPPTTTSVEPGPTTPTRSPATLPTQPGSMQAVDAVFTDIPDAAPADISSSESVRTPAAARASASTLTLPSVSSTAPELPASAVDGRLPERLEVRVRDGEHGLRLGVAREVDGLAVEVRAPRDLVAELRALEPEIDAAVRDDEGRGLASFDATAEDDAGERTDEDDISRPESDAPDTAPRDPTRLLDARV